MKKSEAERVEAAIEKVVRFAHVVPPREAIAVLARWHLRELRRARGRTVGYVETNAETLKRASEVGIADLRGELYRLRQDFHNARVVLLPRAAGRGR